MKRTCKAVIIRAFMVFPVILLCLVSLILPYFFDSDSKWLLYYGQLLGSALAVVAAVIATRAGYSYSVTLAKRTERIRCLKEETSGLKYYLLFLEFSVDYIERAKQSFEAVISGFIENPSEEIPENKQIPDFLKAYERIARYRATQPVPTSEDIANTRLLGDSFLQESIITCLVYIRQLYLCFDMKYANPSSLSYIIYAIEILRGAYSSNMINVIKSIIDSVKKTIEDNRIVLVLIDGDND